MKFYENLKIGIKYLVCVSYTDSSKEYTVI